MSQIDKITLGGGCFWCIEAIFQRVKGVLEVVSGYSGGHLENPTYRQVCGKETGHAEVVEVSFDKNKMSLEEVLEIFWLAHDPTTVDKQGADEGPQYRSVIFYHHPDQQPVIHKSIQDLEDAGLYTGKIVTEVAPRSNFYPAEDYHQNYYNLNTNQGYCRLVIHPKLKKVSQLKPNMLD